MKYLDEIIEVTVSNIIVTDAKTYKYNIVDEIKGSIIFEGLVFLTNDDSSKTFIISDIISNKNYINTSIVNKGLNNENIIGKYNVKLYVDNNEYVSDTVEVYLAYRYPHLLSRLNILSDTNYMCLQGGLKPIYPNIETNNYGINYTFKNNSGANISTERVVSFKNGDKSGHKMISINSESIESNYITLNDVLEYDNYENTYEEFITSDPDILNPNPNLFITENLGNVVDVKMNIGQIVKVDVGQAVVPTEQETHYQFEISAPQIPPTNFTLSIQEHYINLDNPQLDLGKYRISFDCYYDSTIGRLEISNIMLEKENVPEYTEDGIYLKVTNIIRRTGRPTVRAVVYDDMIGYLCDNLDGYYLQWQDRLGGLQSQHFTGHPKFINDYNPTTSVNFKGVKRVISNDISSKWIINSNWINEDEYTNYESIFTSPYLLLYDVKEDKSYFVNITDKQFEEKTFHNQGRQLFNLQLTLEKSDKQNILY